jgi:putative heme-binding domain-containing protein
MQQLGSVFHEVLLLDGSDTAWVDSKIALDGPFTVECWVRLAEGISNEDGILGSPGKIDMNFFQSRFRVWIGEEGLHDVVVAKKPMTPDLWTHVAVTRDARGVFKIYQNGELEATSSKTTTANFENCRVGWSGTSKGTEGAMTEFRVWRVERTAAEIRASFDRVLPADARCHKPVEPQHLNPKAPMNGPVKVTKPGEFFGKGARIAKTIDTPPLLTKEQAEALDTKFAKYSALGHKPGNPEKGKVLSALCLACHTIGSTGGQIGPNLSGAGAMGLEAVLRNIMTPNAAMEAGYRIFRTELKSGDIVDAFFVSEDKDALVVRQPGLQDRRIPKKEVRSTKYIRRSLMPEGLLDALNDEQVTDLMAYLMTLK